MRGEGALLLFQPGHVCVAEESDAIGGQFDNLIHGMGKGVRRLVRKTVNQIDVDAIEAKFACGKEEVTREFIRLDAVHGLLHSSVEILNTHTKPIEAQLAKGFEMGAGGYSRVNLDANLAVAVEVEMFFREGK